MRLSPANLALLPQDVERFGYDRARRGTGIVHFGIGAFCRAHMAWYTDLCMDDGDGDWAISGVSLRSDKVARQLGPQTGLYSLTERRGAEAKMRVIGALREVLVAKEDDKAVTARIAAPACTVASFTVTEKGYCRKDSGSLDFDLAKASFYRSLARGLNARRKAGMPGVTLLSCDNLADNGPVLRSLLLEWCEAQKPKLARWIEAECAFPATMVDRIVPTATPTDLDAAEARLGLRDEGAVFTEHFSQWVIEDSFETPRPAWHNHGAQFVSDVAPYETAKLRMLNGAHSLLAYCGLDRGYAYVHEVIADPGIRLLVDRLMREEAATSFTPAAGQDLTLYANTLIQRFSDPALQHRLVQIAMDGSQKIPQRWLATLTAHQQKGQSCPAILTGISCWLRHLRGDLHRVDDPLSDTFARLWRSESAHGIAKALFGAEGFFARHWQASENDLRTIEKALGEGR